MAKKIVEENGEYFRMETMVEKVGSGELCRVVIAFQQQRDYAKKVIAELNKILQQGDIICVKVSVPNNYKAIDFKVVQVNTNWWHNLGDILVENIKTRKRRSVHFTSIISIKKYGKE